MVDVENVRKAYARVRDALHLRAAPATVRRLVEGLPQESEEEKLLAAENLYLAMQGQTDVFLVVLAATSKEVILPDKKRGPGALLRAISSGQRVVVMAVVERYKGERIEEMCTSTVHCLLQSRLFDNMQLAVDVAKVLPPSAFGWDSPELDCLDSALRLKGIRRHFAVALVLEYGPPMEERLQGLTRFQYVNVAARYCGLKMVQRMHDEVPLIADGANVRGGVRDYAVAVNCAARNSSVANVSSIMEYLVEQADGDVLSLCDPNIVLIVPTIDDITWLLERAPELLERACRKECLRQLLWHSHITFLTEQMAKLVSPAVIVEVVRQPGPGYDFRSAAGPWRRKLRILHQAVPECMDGLRWQWLMDAIEDTVYDDVEYMVEEVCTREHLLMRNKAGDRPYDVAARDPEFPKELLSRLLVAAKGAHA